MLALSSSFIF
ncbi:hypothetical protein LINPERPRIM_LOCUS7672 [Linum perenne]